MIPQSKIYMLSLYFCVTNELNAGKGTESERPGTLRLKLEGSISSLYCGLREPHEKGGQKIVMVHGMEFSKESRPSEHSRTYVHMKSQVLWQFSQC